MPQPIGLKDIYIKNYEYESVVLVAKALASPVRLAILQLLEQGELNIGQVATQLALTQSNASQQIAILENVGLVSCRWEKVSSKGQQKICRLGAHNVVLDLVPAPQRKNASFVEETMPIGLFINVNIDGPCGLVSEQELIGNFDDPGAFLSSRRSQAQLLWFSRGWIEYVFPLPVKRQRQNKEQDHLLVQEKMQKVQAIEFRAELCSEFPGYNELWPSDLTLWFNGRELGTWTSPGDMGWRRGVLTPNWWTDSSTQHGFLTTWRIDEQGCWVNGEPSASELRLSDIDFTQHTGLQVRLGIKEDSANQGGMNLFGRKFGDYAQDLILKFYYK